MFDTKSEEMEEIINDLEDSTLPDIQGREATDHNHEWALDESGCGESKIVEGQDHNHTVIAYEVFPGTRDAHIHKIALPEGWIKSGDTSDEDIYY